MPCSEPVTKQWREEGKSEEDQIRRDVMVEACGHFGGGGGVEWGCSLMLTS